MCLNHNELHVANGEYRDLKRTTILTVLKITLAIAFIFTIFLSPARAIGVEIASVTPTNRRGEIGDTVRIIGTINKTDGLYRIWFKSAYASKMVTEASATGNTVDATFSVPKLPGGNYIVTLQDVEMNINATTEFFIEPTCYIEAKMLTPPKQMQENSTVEIYANITGGLPNTIYSANITVKAPTPANETYSTLVALTNTANTGLGNTTVVYPTHFSGARIPHTNYTGTYTVTFNKTLATNTFFIGLTNSTEYHRLEHVDIKAAGYKPNENVTIKVTFQGTTIDPKVSVNATKGGLIAANWPIPSNASIGTYTINITSTLNVTRKNPPDIQSFMVPGFYINITTRNLAREIVPNVAVQVFEDKKSVVNATSTSKGLVQMKLEIGNYTCRAFYKGEKVSESSINVTKADWLDFDCNLTNLKILVIAVVDGVEIGVPEAKIYLTRENKTVITDINGTAVAHSLLPNYSYVLNASRYDMPPFNTTNIQQLPTKDWVNITIICPTVKLEAYVTDGQKQPIAEELMVRVQELMGGLYYQNNTLNGTAVINCAIGRYKIEVYGKRANNYLKLNETTVNLFEETQIPMVCKIYGLNMSIKVIDYFGQLIPNVNVELQRENLQYPPSESNGLVTFNNIIGGDMRITVYLSGQSNPCVTLTSFVDSSEVIEIKLEKYVVLAGFLVETSSLTTAIIIVATAILVLSIEVYKRRRLKSHKSSS